ncbi:hypothetical protein ACHAXR_012238 [Thalassiosira sp. AJA248-18]
MIVVLPRGSIGVGIRKHKDGNCVVTSRFNAESPLQVQDVIVSVNGIRLSSVEGGVNEWVELFQAFSMASIIRNVVVERPTSIAAITPRSMMPTTNAPAKNDPMREGTSVLTLTDSPLATTPPPDSESAAEVPTTDAIPTSVTMETQGSSDSDTKEGHVAPLDIIAESKYYPHLFREYKGLSDRQKEIFRDFNDPVKWPVPDGYCTKITGVDFEQTLAPFFEEDINVTFSHDSIPNRFAVFMWNMFDACESGSTGGDACRINAVLMAAAKDVIDIHRTQQERIEHLLGLTMAIKRHGLGPFLCRGNPESGRAVFAEIAKEWKRFFEWDPSEYGISDGVREFAKDCCEGVQLMLKPAKYLFNYIRIPRPNRAKKVQKENATKSGDKRKAAADGGTAKKKKKPSEAMKLIERINSIEGVPEDKVFDSCPEVRAKIQAFLERDGITKASLCVALGGINHNSLNRFLSAEDQKQSGNQTYKNGYIFFEKLRILEKKQKSSERLCTELQMEDGFDFSKPKGGRPASYFYFG